MCLLVTQSPVYLLGMSKHVNFNHDGQTIPEDLLNRPRNSKNEAKEMRVEDLYCLVHSNSSNNKDNGNDMAMIVTVIVSDSDCDSENASDNDNSSKNNSNGSVTDI